MHVGCKTSVEVMLAYYLLSLLWVWKQFLCLKTYPVEQFKTRNAGSFQQAGSFPDGRPYFLFMLGKSKIKLLFLCIIKNCENKVNMQKAFPNGWIHGVWPNEVRES